MGLVLLLRLAAAERAPVLLDALLSTGTTGKFCGLVLSLCLITAVLSASRESGVWLIDKQGWDSSS